MSMAEKMKSVGLGIGGVVMVLVLVAIPVIFLYGASWASEKVYPWLAPVFNLTLSICVLLLGPLSFFSKTRAFAAMGFLISSFVFGVILWILSLLLTLELWGMLAAIIGIVLMGIGIVPVALLAALFHADWSSIGSLAMLIVATFGVRMLSLWLAAKADRERQIA
jgi:hypothetical protein